MSGRWLLRPEERLGGQDLLRVHVALEEALLAFGRLEGDHVLLPFEHVDEVGEIGEAALHELRQEVVRQVAVLGQYVDNLLAEFRPREILVVANAPPLVVDASGVGEHRLDPLVLPQVMAHRLWKLDVAVPVERREQRRRRGVAREDGADLIPHRQVDPVEPLQGGAHLWPQAMLVVDDGREILRLGGELVGKVWRVQALQLSQRPARVAAHQVGVGSLEQRLVPVPREPRQLRVLGGGFCIAVHPVQGAAEREMRKLAKLRARATIGEDPVEDGDGALWSGALREKPGNVLRLRKRVAVLRHRVGLALRGLELAGPVLQERQGGVDARSGRLWQRRDRVRVELREQVGPEHLVVERIGESLHGGGGFRRSGSGARFAEDLAVEEERGDGQPHLFQLARGRDILRASREPDRESEEREERASAATGGAPKARSIGDERASPATGGAPQARSIGGNSWKHAGPQKSQLTPPWKARLLTTLADGVRSWLSALAAAPLMSLSFEPNDDALHPAESPVAAEPDWWIAIASAAPQPFTLLT